MAAAYGARVPTAAEMNPAPSMPWTIHSPKRLLRAYSGSQCSGLVSPLTSANFRMSSALTVFENSARCPTFTSGTESATTISQQWTVTLRYVVSNDTHGPRQLSKQIIPVPNGVEIKCSTDRDDA